MKTEYSHCLKNLTVPKDIESGAKSLTADLLKKADGSFNNFEDFLTLPFANQDGKLEDLVKKVKHVVVVGIGGSSLGPKSVYHALFGCYDTVEPKRFPKLHFIDNVDSKYLGLLMGLFLDLELTSKELAFVIICKSGKTFEVHKNIEILENKKYLGLFKGANTFVVSVEGNDTWVWGEKFGAKLFSVHNKISGRFQIFGPVSTMALALAGISTFDFLEGAKASTAEFTQSEKFSSLRYQLYKTGLDTDVYFSFDDRLKVLADWNVSITAESLGKDGVGITPIASVGSKDDHSTLQLYLQGPKNKFTFFISLSDTNPNTIKSLNAVKKSYNDLNLPYVHIELDAQTDAILTRELGGFMQTRIIDTVILGGLIGVNPYNQPGVELYKKYLN